MASAVRVLLICTLTCILMGDTNWNVLWWRLKWAGLLPFARLVESIPGEKRLAIDGSLLSCLVDRWRPETHTFHFRWGEMAPTLEDVSLLLGLPLASHAIGPLDAPAGWEWALTQRFHGVFPDAPDPVWEHHWPKYDWLLNFQVSSPTYYLQVIVHMVLQKIPAAY